MMNSLCDRCLHLIRRGLSSSAPLFQSYRLIEIGKLEDPQNSGYYQAGQVSSHAIAVYIPISNMLQCICFVIS